MIGLATPRTDLVEQAGQVLAADGVPRNHRDRFVRGVIDYAQAFDRAARSRPVKDKIHRPDLVGRTRPDQRLPIRRRNLLAAPTTHL